MAVLQAQIQLFQHIKSGLAPHLSLVDEVGEVLGVSYDSAYRRIRGEKELSFTELQKLLSHFHISANEALQTPESDDILFKYKPLSSTGFNLHDYLSSANQIIHIISKHTDADLIYAAKDIPVFHYFLIDEVGWFKMFVWQKTIIGFPEFEKQKFSLKNPDEKIMETGRQLLREYNKFGSTEIWNEETILSYLRQVEFYCEAGLFEDVEDAFIILDKLSQYVDHLHSQAELGVKFDFGSTPGPNAGKFELYNNEVVRADNTILVRLGDKYMTFLTHCAMNFLSTANERFCVTTRNWLINLTRRSSLISSVAEKHRNRFFGDMQDQICKSRERVKFLVGQHV